jgi:magnesium-transporting ATPase (P-type)
MRKLDYIINLEHFRQIKRDIVPILLTEHQFHLTEKKFTNKKMTDSEKNEFSRTVSRKMRAINKILEKETDNVYIYGKNKIKKERLKLAIKYIKKFSRKFKNKHIFIVGSFLYNSKYNDIDVFVVSKYEKEDYRSGKFHINYLPEDVYDSLLKIMYF